VKAATSITQNTTTMNNYTHCNATAKKRRVKIVTDQLEGSPLSICIADAISNDILTEVATVRPEGILRWMNAKPDETVYDLTGFTFDEQGRLAVSCL